MGNKSAPEAGRSLAGWRARLARRFGRPLTATPSASPAPSPLTEAARGRPRSRSWLIKSLSSSTSALLSPLRRARQHQQQAEAAKTAGSARPAAEPQTSPYKRLRQRLVGPHRERDAGADRKCGRIAQLLGSPRLFRRRKRPQDEQDKSREMGEEIRTKTPGRQLRLVSAGSTSEEPPPPPPQPSTGRAESGPEAGFYANEFGGACARCGDLIEQLGDAQPEIMGGDDNDDEVGMRPLVRARSPSSSSSRCSRSSSGSSASSGSSCTSSLDEVKVKVADGEAMSVSQPPQPPPPPAAQRQRLQRAPSSGVAALRSNFRRLVKRQQSVDSYRMARELKNKQRRQHADGRQKHQSNEAIPTGPPVGADNRRELARLLLEPVERCHAQAAEAAGTPSAGRPTPPSSLSLGVAPAAKGTSRHHLQQPFVVGTFSGSITPTYPTHQLASPKCQPRQRSSAESSSLATGRHQPELLELELQLQDRSASATSAATSGEPQTLLRLDVGAAKRAQLAEHIYDNKCGLGDDMKFLASLPELCDITFLVGETREPVCAVKSVLAARSRVFHKILFGGRRRHKHQQVQADWDSSNTALELGSPASRQPSPAEPSARKPHWSVVADASGYATGGPQETQGRGSAAGQLRASLVGLDSLAAQSRATSQSPQQPLIIGPGQRAAPAPRSAMQPVAGAHRKRSDSKRFKATGESGRLSRMFLKRASAELGGEAPASSGGLSPAQTPEAGDPSHLDKMSSSQMSTTMIIEEFEPDVFRQLIEYIHTGCVLLQARTLLGLLNAADYYGLEQLRRACLRFVSCCITVDTVCSLLSTAERYIQYKCTKSIVQKVLEFVDSHADEIFKLNAFGLLPEHVVRLILARDGLQAAEEVKYAGVYTWCEHYCRSYELADISSVMQNFLDFIHFHKISSQFLLQEIYPARVVPDNVILIALAYQADPARFEPQPAQARRMTLPNPICYGRGSATPAPDAGPEPRRSPAKSRDSEQQQQQQPPPPPPPPPRQLRGRKSTGGSGQLQDSVAVATGGHDKPERASRLRKGSIAQVSLSGMVRLSHRLSIKKRHSQASTEPQRRCLGSSASNWVGDKTQTGGKRAAKALGKQQSAAFSNQLAQDDPILVGKQILDAYLEERRRQLEAEEEEERRRLAELARETPPKRSSKADQPAPVQTKQTSQSHRKSFRDFRNMFKRHSSSKSVLQQQHSALPATWQPAPSAQRDKDKDKDKDKRRSVFRRSETVFEAG